MLDILGALLAICGAYALASGPVVARSRDSGRSVTRAAEPRYFRVVLSIYAALAAALVLWF